MGSEGGKQHYAIKILDLVLTCVGHHDYEVLNIFLDVCALMVQYCFFNSNITVKSLVISFSFKVAQITFNLWYRLSELLYQKNNDDLNAVFRSYIERLIGALCRHCQMEPDHVSIRATFHRADNATFVTGLLITRIPYQLPVGSRGRGSRRRRVCRFSKSRVGSYKGRSVCGRE